MKVTNRKARYDYDLLEKYEAGIALKGKEVRSVKKGQMDLSSSYGKILGDEAFLINASIPLEGESNQ